MDTKIMTVTSAKTKCPGKLRPKLRISGFWLDSIGFEYDRLVTVTHESGSLVFKVYGKGTDTYMNLVKGVLKNKSGLLQVRHAKANKKKVPSFEVKGQWLENLGFRIGSVVAVQFQSDIIRVRLIDLDKLDLGNMRDCSMLE